MIVNERDAPTGLADAAGSSQVDWLGYRKPGHSDGPDNSESIPFAQPIHPGYGITTDEFAAAQRRFSTYARLRLQGVGHTQYDQGGKQSFEDMTVHRLVDELRDEIADAVNYLAMIDIQLSRWKRKLEELA